MWSEAERREVFDALEPALGGRIATLMTQGPPFDWSEIVRRSDLDAATASLRADMDAQFTAVRGEIVALGGELRGEIGDLRGEMGELRGEIGELRGEIGELRGEVGELRGHIVGIDGRLNGLVGRQVLANIPIMFGTAALVLAAVKLG